VKIGSEKVQLDSSAKSSLQERAAAHKKKKRGSHTTMLSDNNIRYIQVKPEDSFDDFQKRGMELEYQLYRQALDLLCDNQITGQGAGHERSHQNRS
jgi:hypothetical protein